MAIISRSDKGKLRYGSNQLRYCAFYVGITFLVLLFLNLYCSDICITLFHRSKHTAILEKALLVSQAVGEEEILNSDTARDALENLDNLKYTRLIITDFAGLPVYDSMPQDVANGYCVFPEVVQALKGNDVVTIDYIDGALVSKSAVPILSYNNLTGCAYVMEYDAEQGQLISSLRRSILGISIVLCLIVVVASLISSRAFTARLRKIMTSMRIIREGNYDHKVDMGGNDELTVLGSEFNDLTTKLRESEERQRQFVSDASHELKTPLASIKLLSDSILQNDMDVQTVREFVADIGDEADRLTRMSEKLLSLTRFHPDIGKDMEITYVGPTIERVVRMLSTIADMAWVTLETEIGEDSSILILEDDLYQIIFNLVENGIKYNIDGGALTVRLTRDRDNAILTISDTGVGIPDDSVEHIFERFYRVDKARSRETGGSGLGLSIVHDMVVRNRGEISVQSSQTPPTGTTFTLVFPVFDVEEAQ